MGNEVQLHAKNMNDLMVVAEKFAMSDIIPSDYRRKPNDILVAIQWGSELGFNPMASLNNIYIVKGRPSLSSQSMLGLAKRQRDYAGMVMKKNTDEECEVAIARRLPDGSREEQTGYFSMKDAKKAGLAGKDNWQNYSRNMLEARAISFALRKLYPDLFAGIMSSEERQDIPVDNAPSEPIDVTPAVKLNTTRNSIIEKANAIKAEPAAPEAKPDEDNQSELVIALNEYAELYGDKPAKVDIIEWATDEPEEVQKHILSLLKEYEMSKNNSDRIKCFLKMYASNNILENLSHNESGLPWNEFLSDIALKEEDTTKLNGYLNKCHHVIWGS